MGAAQDNADANKSGCASVESFSFNVMSSFDGSVKLFRAVDDMSAKMELNQGSASVTSI